MLEQMKDLPDGVVGLRATGKISKEDYESIVIPIFETARRQGERIRFLYHFGPDFDGFTPLAAWQDMRLGMRYLRLFEKCAVVSDLQWIQTASRAIAVTMPCPVRVFDNDAIEDAMTWLQASAVSSLDHRVLPDRGVVVIEPKGTLRAEDFDALESDVDAWIDGAGGTLHGMVVKAREFPGWKNLGSAIRHIRFIKDHHKKIRRFAWAADSKLAALAPPLAKHFVDAEVKRFGADEVDEAISWASQESAIAYR